MYLSKNQSKRREEVRIYAVKFPPKDLEKKVGIMSDIRKSLEAHETELHLKKSEKTDAWLDDIKVGGVR